MMLTFDFLSSPIEISSNNINILCIENRPIFSKVVEAFRNGTEEESNIVLSQNYNPIKFKDNIVFIYDYFDLSLPSSLNKKIYESLSQFCTNEMPTESALLKQNILNFLDRLNYEFDFDFSYNLDLNFPDFFKSQNFKPTFEKESLIENLFDYILTIQKYQKIKGFILLNPSLYFDENQLNQFYGEILKRQISLLIIESTNSKNNFINSKTTILDEDLCEIVES